MAPRQSGSPSDNLSKAKSFLKGMTCKVINHQSQLCKMLHESPTIIGVVSLGPTEYVGQQTPHSLLA